MIADKAIYVRVFQAPALFGMSRTTFYRWINAGTLTVHKPKNGRMSFLKISEVIEAIERLGD